MSNYFAGSYFAPTYFAQGFFTDAAVELPDIRIIPDDGGEVIKRSFYDRQVREFEEALAALAGDAPQEAAQTALQAFQPIRAVADGNKELEAAQAISTALHAAMERTKGHAGLVRTIEAELARLIAMRRRRRDEIALLMLGAL